MLLKCLSNVGENLVLARIIGTRFVTVVQFFLIYMRQRWVRTELKQFVIRKELFIINSAYLWLDWGGLYFTEKRKFEICVE